MESQDNKRSAIDHLDSITFKVGLKGYNVDEVDEYLERLSGEVGQLKEMVSQLRQQLRVAQERATSGPVTGSVPTVAAASGVIQVGRVASSTESDTVTSMISMAQKFVEQAKIDAEAKARELMSAAQERARDLVADAKSRAEDEVTRLNGLKQRLGEDIETLSSRLESERARLTTVVVEFSRWIEGSFKINQDQPAEAAVEATSTPQSQEAAEVESFIVEAQESAPVAEERPEVPPAAPAPVPAPEEERKQFNASAGATWPPKPTDR
jgi:DivIVA domain-containing protein